LLGRRASAGRRATGCEPPEISKNLVEIRISGPELPGEPVSGARGDRVAVGDHVELADLAGLESGVDVELLFDGGGETRSLGLAVASGHAVTDGDLHAASFQVAGQTP